MRISADLVTTVSEPVGSSETARLRRTQVIDAAMDLIAGQGLHKLSLSQIEARTGMARGHLTYYFPTKEAILLAVFDRMLERMIEGIHEHVDRTGGPKPGTGRAWDCVRFMFHRHLLEDHDANQRAFGSLLHTFLAQIPYREDYRRKLAEQNRAWRELMAADFAESVPGLAVPPAALASVVMALVQGLTQQRVVDPDGFDRTATLEIILQMLAPFFRASVPTSGETP